MFGIDYDVERVLAFMQENIRPLELLAVARAVAQIADLDSAHDKYERLPRSFFAFRVHRA